MTPTDPATFISDAYETLLGRAPDAGGQSFWLQQLANGASPQAVRAAIAASPEARADITGLYQQTLDRTPDAGGLAFWQQQLANGMSLQAVQAAMAASPEAQVDINNLYLQTFGHAPDAADLAEGQGQLASGTALAAMQVTLAGSPEVGSDLTALYNQVFGFDPMTATLGALEGQVVSGTSFDSVRTELQQQSAEQLSIIDQPNFDGDFQYGDRSEYTGGVTDTLYYSNESATLITTTPPDTLVLLLSADTLQDTPQFIATIDGQKVGGGPVSALYDAGDPAQITLSGYWGPGPHNLAIIDAGSTTSSGADDAIHVDGIVYNGVALTGAATTLTPLGNQSAQFIVGAPPTHTTS